MKATLAPVPTFAIHVVWHPGFTQGSDLANALFRHYTSNAGRDLNSGMGIPVFYYSNPVGGAFVPKIPDFHGSKTCAVVVLVDKNLIGSPEWVAYFKALEASAAAFQFDRLLVPVTFEAGSLKVLDTKFQAIRVDAWLGMDPEEVRSKLFALLTYQLVRMIRLHLEKAKLACDEEDLLEAYLKKISVFLSHSKHDGYGQELAKSLRKILYDDFGLDSFFDVVDITPGLQFDKVILHSVKRSAVVAIHTDSYSTREWCRREILEAKRAGRPIVVANCLVDREERGFPYLGNAPVIRIEPGNLSRLIFVIERLLDVVLNDLLWELKVVGASAKAAKGVEFISSPPELLTLARFTELDGAGRKKAIPKTLVYPDPPLSLEEEALFQTILPGTDIKSFEQWQSHQIK